MTHPLTHFVKFPLIELFMQLKIITDHIGSLSEAPEFFQVGTLVFLSVKKNFVKKFVHMHSYQIYQNIHALILVILTHTYLKSVDLFKSCDSFFKDRQNLKSLYFWVQKQIIRLLTWKEDKFCTNMLKIFHWYIYLLGKSVLNIFRAPFWNANSVQRLLTYPNTWS